MKYAIVWVMALGLLAITGCENQELIQCQQDKQEIQDSLDLMKKEKTAADQSLDFLMEQLKENQSQIKTLQGQIETLTQEKADIQALRQKERGKLDEALLGLRKVDELEKELATTRDELEAVKALVGLVTEENKTLRDKIKELEAAPKAENNIPQ